MTPPRAHAHAREIVLTQILQGVGCPKMWGGFTALNCETNTALKTKNEKSAVHEEHERYTNVTRALHEEYEL